MAKMVKDPLSRLVWIGIFTACNDHVLEAFLLSVASKENWRIEIPDNWQWPQIGDDGADGFLRVYSVSAERQEGEREIEWEALSSGGN